MNILARIINHNSQSGKMSAAAKDESSLEKHARELAGLGGTLYESDPEMIEWRLQQVRNAREVEKKVDRNEATPDDFLWIAAYMTNLTRFNMGRLYVEEALRRAEARDQILVRSFTFFITELCNLRCAHCYIYDDMAGDFLRRSDEMNIDKVLKIVDSIDRFNPEANVFFSGGEVFARPDIEDIFNALASRKRRFAFGTNGMFPERLDAVLATDEIRAVLSNVQFSIDGIKESHERIRGPRTFEPLVRSIKIAKKHGVQINATTVIQEGNLDDIDATAALGKELGIDYHKFQYHARGEKLHVPGFERYRHLVDPAEFHMAAFNPTVPGAGCTAGIDGCTIRSNGVVEACRMSVVESVRKLVLGDLAEFDYDMGALLRSDQAKKTQRQVQKCTGCAFYCAR